MDKKRPLTEKELEYYANLSDSESDKMFSENNKVVSSDDEKITMLPKKPLPIRITISKILMYFPRKYWFVV